MVEKKDVRVLGEANQNVPQVVPLMMEVLGYGGGLVSKEGAKRMAELLKQMQGCVPQEVVKGKFDKMSQQQQENLRAFMAAEAT